MLEYFVCFRNFSLQVNVTFLFLIETESISSYFTSKLGSNKTDYVSLEAFLFTSSTSKRLSFKEK